MVFRSRVLVWSSPCCSIKLFKRICIKRSPRARNLKNFCFGDKFTLSPNFFKANAFDLLSKATEHIEYDIQLLICDSCNRVDGIIRRKVQEWCIINGWELIELEMPEDVDPDNDFEMSWGFTRIKQALNAHTWSNLCLKEGKDSCTNDRVCDDTKVLESRENCDIITKCSNINRHSDFLAESSGSLTNFDELFGKFEKFKTTADTLPIEERRKYAEKVTVAFWKAIGGSEDEIEGICDSDVES